MEFSSHIKEGIPLQVHRSCKVVSIMDYVGLPIYLPSRRNYEFVICK